MSSRNNSRNQIKRTFGLVVLLIGLVILVIVPSSSGSGPSPLAFGNKNRASTQVGRSEVRHPRQPTFNTIGYHFPAQPAPVDLSAGLIGHWPLDGNADDTSGNGHNGTISGATPTTGRFGGAYNFNGSASIDVGDLDFSSEQYTVSSWIRTDLPAETASWKDWLTKLDIPSGTGTFMLLLGDGRVCCAADGPSVVVWQAGGIGVVSLQATNLNFRDGNWHHVAITYQNGSQQLYADGVLVGTSAYPGPLPLNAASVVIGGIEGFGPYHHRWVGDIDEVSIYNRVLDCAEIAAIFNGGPGQCNSAGLIGHWPLDGNADDTSGNGHNGTISGATPTTGKCGGAYNFNGSASIDVGNLDFSSGQFTVSTWIRTDLPGVTDSYKDWLTKLDIPSGTGTFMLSLGDGRPGIGGGDSPYLVVWRPVGQGDVTSSATNLNYRDGNWHHVAATYQNGSQQLYADGVLVGTRADPGPLPLNAASVVIGGIEGFGPYHHRWVGDIDEVSIYGRVLDASEISAIFNAGSGCPNAKANQIVTFGALGSKVFGDPDFGVSATASSGLPVSFAAGGQCTVSGNTVHITGAGSCTITASQGGDSNYNPAPSVPQGFNIAKAGTTMALNSSVNPSDLGQNVTFTATVSSGAGMPTGTAQFKDNGANLGAPVALNAGGVAQLTTSSLAVGTHTVTGDYSGDANFAGSTGTLVPNQQVNCPTLVTNNADSGQGSLRDIIIRACPGSTITFDPSLNGQTITLTSGELLVNKSLTIQGPGANLLTISGNNASRVFNVNVANPGVVTFSGLTISNGKVIFFDDAGGVFNQNNGTINFTNSTLTNNSTNSPSNAANGGNGGAIYNRGGTVNVTNSTLTNNSTNSHIVGNESPDRGRGGAIYNRGGTVNVTNSTLTNNSTSIEAGAGGAIYNRGGTVNVTNSTLNSNNGVDSGGGISNSGGTVNVTNSTLSNNSTIGGGGGISNSAGTLNVTNSTLSNNSVTSFNGNFFGGGGGIYSISGTVNVTNSTLSNNSGGESGGGINNYNAQVQIRNSIIALNTASSGPDLSGTMTSQGHNLIGKSDGSTGLTNGVNGDIVGTIAAPINPLLGPLANNGGPTQTMALLPGSPAINAGDSAAITNPPFSGPPFTDQRDTGFNRIVNATVDIGAFESRGFTIAVTSGSGQSATITTAFAAPLVATVSSAAGEPVAGGVVTFTALASGPSGLFTGNLITVNVTTDGSGVATSPTLTANNLAGGPYNVTATGNGITGSATFSLTNNKAATTTAVSSSVNPSDLNQSVTFTATVTSGGETPTGTAQFKDNGTNLGPPAALNPGGVAQLTTSALTAGTHTITADYSGDANFLGSSGTLAGGQVVRPQPSLSINDVSITEGDSGTKTMNFTATLSAASNLTVNVNFATANGTATAPSDYVATNGTMTFNSGDLTKTIGVTINGDQNFEPDENFIVNLSNAVNATISDNQGVGTILNDDAQGGFISFSQPSYSVNEADGFITITVNRSNDTSRAATVDYATDDSGAPGSCSVVNGLASARCDFTTALGTLKFAPGETQKTFTVLVNRDAYAEGPEMFSVNLSNLTGGAVLIAPSQAMVTITDGLGGPPPNLVDDASFFVRQHYHDFLNREPDAAGLAFWTNQITLCGADAQCIDIKRLNVSAAFFLSIEFQDTGGAAYLANKAAFGAVPTYSRFERDSQALGQGYIFGTPGAAAIIEANKVAYFNDFVNRPEFISIYGFLFNGQYVDALIANTGVSFTQAERDALLNGMNASTETQATVLRKISEKQSFRQAESNQMFVLMEYFGFLRRDPDAAGFTFWLNKLNQFNGNFINAEMVKAFLLSAEYRHRFGP
jgi:hypothetical protein